MKEKEQERHKKVLEQIKQAKTIKDLPSVTTSTLTSYLAKKSSFNGVKIPANEFMSVVDARLGYGIFLDIHVEDAYVEVLKKYYPTIDEEELRSLFMDIMQECKAENLISEIEQRNLKIYTIKRLEFFKNHEEIMHLIGSAVEKKDFYTKELSKVSRANVASYILSTLKEEKLSKLTSEDTKEIVRIFVEETDNCDRSIKLYEICSKKYGFRCSEVYELLSSQLASDYKVDLYIEEVIAKENRIKQIYKQEYEDTMMQIEDATRISELPTNLSLSTITSYLAGNSTLGTRTKILSGSFSNLAEMLLEGKTLNDKECCNELERVAAIYYTEEKVKTVAEILKEKFLKLPKLNYIIRAVKCCKKRQEEFIARGGSNVFTYMIPNPKSPMDAGKFYNIYISRTKNLNFEEILPLDLDKIVPKGLDIDSIEWYVRKNYDRTFKLAGGVIVNRDEEIGEVKVFKPSDGKIGVTKEEKTKLDELKELSEELKKTVQAQKQDMAEKFSKMQQELLSSEQQLNDQFNIIEEKIKKLGGKKDE